MIDKMHNKVLWPVLGAALLGVTLAGCGNNGADDTTTTETTTTAPEPSTQDKAASIKGNGEAAPAEIAAFFPGATLTPKPFPFSDDAASHLAEDAGVKFSGDEGKWEVYEASQNGQRIGMALMTHSALPDGGDMHIAFAVDKNFKITKVTAIDAPDTAKMEQFLKQAVGKDLSDSFKVVESLKVPADLSPQVAQTAADAVKKGLAILDSNFNAAHGGGETAAGHQEGDGHSHEGTTHKEGDGHSH